MRKNKVSNNKYSKGFNKLSKTTKKLNTMKAQRGGIKK